MESIAAISKKKILKRKVLSPRCYWRNKFSSPQSTRLLLLGSQFRRDRIWTVRRCSV